MVLYGLLHGLVQYRTFPSQPKRYLTSNLKVHLIPFCTKKCTNMELPISPDEIFNTVDTLLAEEGKAAAAALEADGEGTESSSRHHCPGITCKHVVLMYPEQTYVCYMSGRCFDQNFVQAQGNFVGGTEEGNEICCAPKKNMGFVNASRAAHRITQQSQNNDCDQDNVWSIPKTSRSMKKEPVPRNKSNDTNSTPTLFADSCKMLDLVMNMDAQSTNFQLTNQRLQAVNMPAANLASPRAIVEMYIKDCARQNVCPHMHTLHDMLLAADLSKISKTQQGSIAKECHARSNWYLRTRRAFACLVCDIWRLSLKTSYMLTARRSQDGFRQFGMGILYATIRGLFLVDGSTLVPRCPIIANNLPNLRSRRNSSCGKLSRSLRLSAHKGLCTVHRVIASVVNSPSVFWQDAIEKAAILNQIQAEYALL